MQSDCHVLTIVAVSNCVSQRGRSMFGFAWSTQLHASDYIMAGRCTRTRIQHHILQEAYYATGSHRHPRETRPGGIEKGKHAGLST